MIKQTFREVGKKASELYTHVSALEEYKPDLDLRHLSGAAQGLAERASDRAKGKWPVPNKEASATINGMIDALPEALSHAPWPVQNDQTIKTLMKALFELRDRKTGL